MRKIFLLIFMFLMLLTSCGTKITYPLIEYRNSSYNFDIANKTILLEDGYVLDEANSYNIIETKNGYDIVLHIIKE